MSGREHPRGLSGNAGVNPVRRGVDGGGVFDVLDGVREVHHAVEQDEGSVLAALRDALLRTTAASAVLVSDARMAPVGFSVPLLVHGEPARSVVLLADAPLGDADRRIAETLVGCAANVLALLAARRTAREDALTGLLNRRAIIEELTEEVERARRTGLPLACLVVDVDRFKVVNDRWGHDAGDEVLRTIAGALCDELRGYDRVARYGGDEFVVVLPGAAGHAARLTAARLLEHGWRVGPPGEPPHEVRLSIGLAQWRDPLTCTELLARADAALMSGKRAGRSALVVAEG